MYHGKGCIILFFVDRRQHDWVVRTADLKARGHGFKSHSDHQLVLFLVIQSSNTLVKLKNSQLVQLLPLGF